MEVIVTIVGKLGEKTLFYETYKLLGLREFPGTPRNGTPFWEASHTIPIPLP